MRLNGDNLGMFDAPEYLYGDARIRWHRRRAASNYTAAAITGSVTAAALHNKTGPYVATAAHTVFHRAAAQYGVTTSHTPASFDNIRRANREDIAIIGGGTAVGMVIGGGIHTHKAKKYNKEYQARKKKKSSNAQIFHSTKAYYFRKQNGKTVRVRKGKRK